MTSAAPRRQKHKVASTRSWAKLDWKPWEPTADGLLPSDGAIHELGVAARIAYAVMLKSVDDLINMHKTAQAETIDAMFDNFLQDEKSLRQIADMIKDAHMRLLSAGCKLLLTIKRDARRKKPRLKIVSTTPTD